ncbi:MAG: DUF434 domain-containing protein [Planctomycetes bacterium]|nr:DUF434 domain-containing protein [Planctomycetota bacterium]
MPDTRSHRGPHPEDGQLFRAAMVPTLCRATADLCWLLDRGYARPSSLKLVGDRHELAARQRTAVARCACTTDQRIDRQRRRIEAEPLAGGELWLDGYNVLTSVEAALAGGVILEGVDGSYRDMASMHGSYRRVEETVPALERIARVTEAAGVRACRWLLDRPVSNSGRLKTVIERLAAERDWNWRIDLVADPDPLLAECETTVATADSEILDHCRQWFNLARETIHRHVPEARVVRLVGASG